MDVGLLIARLVFGLLLAAHGCQKLFGWFAGPRIGGTALFFERLGFYPGRLFVIAAAFSLALTGPGAYSLDSLLELTRWWTPQVTAIALGAGVLGAVLSLGLRRSGTAIAHA